MVRKGRENERKGEKKMERVRIKKGGKSGDREKEGYRILKIK